MSDQALIQRLDTLPEGTDFTDPNTYAELLGYNNPQGGQQADTAAVTAQTVEAQPAQATVSAPEPQAASSAPAGAAEAQDGADVAGVATRDGKRVIPFSVLSDTRAARQHAEQRAAQVEAQNQQLTQELQALREQMASAKPGDQQPARAALQRVDAARIEETRADFPELAEQMEARNALIDQMEAMQGQLQAIAQQRPAQPQAAAAQEDIQTLIDQRPLLAQWQAKGGMAWDAAVKMDDTLRADAAWASKPQGERFAEVERRIAAEFGVPVPPPTPNPTPSSAAAPAAAPKPQPVQAAHPTLTDLAGAAAVLGDPTKGMSTTQMADMANGMSMEELRKLAGLSY